MTAVAIDVEGVSAISDPITVVVTGPRGAEDDDRDNEGHPVEQPRRR